MAGTIDSNEQMILEEMSNTKLFGPEIIAQVRNYFDTDDVSMTPDMTRYAMGYLGTCYDIMTNIAPNAGTYDEKMAALSKSAPDMKRAFFSRLFGFYKVLTNGCIFIVSGDYILARSTKTGRVLFPAIKKSILTPLLWMSNFVASDNKITVPVNLRNSDGTIAMTFSFQI